MVSSNARRRATAPCLSVALVSVCARHAGGCCAGRVQKARCAGNSNTPPAQPAGPLLFARSFAGRPFARGRLATTAPTLVLFPLRLLVLSARPVSCRSLLVSLASPPSPRPRPFRRHGSRLVVPAQAAAVGRVPEPEPQSAVRLDRPCHLVRSKAVRTYLHSASHETDLSIVPCRLARCVLPVSPTRRVDRLASGRAASPARVYLILTLPALLYFPCIVCSPAITVLLAGLSVSVVEARAPVAQGASCRRGLARKRAS